MTELNAEQIVAALKEWNECHLPNMCIDTDGKCWQFCNDGDCVVVQAIDLIESLLDQLAERDLEIERIQTAYDKLSVACQNKAFWNDCDKEAEIYEQAEEIKRLREAISRYCRNDCYRDTCAGNEDVGIPDCPLTEYSPPLPEPPGKG